MVIVLDTNTIISALLSKSGAPAQVIDVWEAEKFDVAISAPLLDELARVLYYEKINKLLALSQVQIEALIKSLRRVAVFVEPREKITVIQADPDDDRVLECAVEAGADYIVSGGKHLLDLKEFRGIVILSAPAFLALLTRGSDKYR